MKRREVIKLLAAAGGVALVGSALAQPATRPKEKEQTALDAIKARMRILSERGVIFRPLPDYVLLHPKYEAHITELEKRVGVA